jgi:threonine/homoserine/homoserine lactone efflux protein
VGGAGSRGSGEAGLPRALPSAVLVNLLNPGPYLYWSLVAGPILLRAWRRDPACAVSFAVGFYAAMVASLCVLIAAFAATRTLGRRVERALSGLAALALAAFGAYQLWQGLAG